METGEKIFVAGHRGLVGSAVVRKLEAQGFTNLVLKTRAELDLTDQHAVNKFFESVKPARVFLCAAKVGGIMANNDQKADFIYQNLQIQNNIIHSAYRHGVKKLLFLGSSCIYPRECPQPMKEEYLLTGPLETTNDAYAIAKIAGIKMCQSFNAQYGANFISPMPTNLYGPNDNFDLETSHVVPALIRRFHEAKQTNAPSITLWGTGTVYREFLHVDDLADALLFLMQNYDSPEIINIGTGTDLTVKELAALIQKITGYTGAIEWDPSKPDGTPKKLLDIAKINKLGWKALTSLEEGLAKTYDWYLKNH